MPSSFSSHNNPPPNSHPPAPTQKSSPSSPNSPVVHQSASTCYNSTKNSSPPTSPGGAIPQAAAHEVSVPRQPLPSAHRLKNFPPLTDQQLNAIEILVLGHSDAYVASQIKTHRTTVTRWRLHNPRFRAALFQRRNEIWGSSADRFRKYISRALSVLHLQMNSFDDKTSHRAARTILSMASSKKFAPPDEPQDPAGIIEQIARQKKIESPNPNDPRFAEINEEDILRAIQHLDELNRGFPLSHDSAPLT